MRGRAAPVVVPALGPGRVFPVEDVQAALVVNCLGFLIQDTAEAK